MRGNSGLPVTGRFEYCRSPFVSGTAAAPPGRAPGGQSGLGAYSLVRHRVYDVVDPDSHAQGREALRVLRIVRVLPRVTEIHVVADRDHHPPMVVVNSAPVGLV